MWASRPSRGSMRATPAGESSKHAPPPAASTTVMQLEAEYGVSRSRSQASSALAASSSSRRSTRCTGTPSSPRPSRRVVEDVERDRDAARRDADLGQDPGLGHGGEARALDGRRPHEAALGRIGVPVPVLRQPRPLRALAAADGRALGEREQLGAPVERRDELGLEPRPERERLQLRRQRRMPALGALEHARPEAPDVVEPVPEVGEQRQVRRQAERSALGQRRLPPHGPRTRGSVASVRSVASAVSAGADMRAG